MKRLSYEKIEEMGWFESPTWAYGVCLNEDEEIYPGTKLEDNTIETHGENFRGVSLGGYLVFDSELSWKEPELAKSLPEIENSNIVFIGEDNSLNRLVLEHYHRIYESTYYEFSKFPNLDFYRLIDDSEGVVIIEGFGDCLHPKHQRSLYENLVSAFPNVKFILTTHSPLVLSEVPNDSYRILSDGKVFPSQTKVEGRDGNSLLFEIFGVDKRPIEVEKKINKFYSLLEEKKLQEAEEILTQLANSMGETDIEIVRMNSYLDFERD